MNSFSSEAKSKCGGPWPFVKIYCKCKFKTCDCGHMMQLMTVASAVTASDVFRVLQRSYAINN